MAIKADPPVCHSWGHSTEPWGQRETGRLPCVSALRIWGLQTMPPPRGGGQEPFPALRALGMGSFCLLLCPLLPFFPVSFSCSPHCGSQLPAHLSALVDWEGSGAKDSSFSVGEGGVGGAAYGSGAEVQGGNSARAQLQAWLCPFSLQAGAKA